MLWREKRGDNTFMVTATSFTTISEVRNFSIALLAAFWDRKRTMAAVETTIRETSGGVAHAEAKSPMEDHAEAKTTRLWNTRESQKHVPKPRWQEATAASWTGPNFRKADITSAVVVVFCIPDKINVVTGSLFASSSSSRAAHSWIVRDASSGPIVPNRTLVTILVNSTCMYSCLMVLWQMLRTRRNAAIN